MARRGRGALPADGCRAAHCVTGAAGPHPAVRHLGGTYLVPFAALRHALRIVSINGHIRIDLTYEEFLAAVRQLLQAVRVDEGWYRATYPDVAAAIDQGAYRDGQHHFVANGYLEMRQPFFMAVDEEWYLHTYPDVRDGIEEGAFQSAQDHFERHGYQEGRRPAGIKSAF